MHESVHTLFDMATSKFFLDTRQTKNGNPSLLKIAIRNNNSTAYISMNIHLFPNQWDSKKGIILSTHSQYRTLNAYLLKIKGEIDVEIMSLSNTGGVKRLKASELKNKLLKIIHPDKVADFTPSFSECFKEFMSQKSKSTQGVYAQTFVRINSCTNIENLCFQDITPEWLAKFDKFMSLTAPSRNARNIHLRNIRAVFNYAIDNEYTSAYPFRRFKIHAEVTRKRSLTVEDLRSVFEYPVEDYARIYRDLFKLIFMLIGINVVDLHRLKEIKHGRIEYRRAKTGRLYSIKVEPEAMEIINKYKGVNGLLCIADRWTDHRNFRHQINNALQRIGEVERVGRGGKKIITPKWPELTTYWARHTWATIARKIGISKDDIALALGHADDSHSTTNIYIDEDLDLIDSANRKVLDWVLYKKK